MTEGSRYRDIAASDPGEKLDVAHERALANSPCATVRASSRPGGPRTCIANFEPPRIGRQRPQAWRRQIMDLWYLEFGCLVEPALRRLPLDSSKSGWIAAPVATSGRAEPSRRDRAGMQVGLRHTQHQLQYRRGGRWQAGSCPYAPSECVAALCAPKLPDCPDGGLQIVDSHPWPCRWEKASRESILREVLNSLPQCSRVCDAIAHHPSYRRGDDCVQWQR